MRVRTILVVFRCLLSCGLRQLFSQRRYCWLLDTKCSSESRSTVHGPFHLHTSIHSMRRLTPSQTVHRWTENPACSILGGSVSVLPIHLTTPPSHDGIWGPPLPSWPFDQGGATGTPVALRSPSLVRYVLPSTLQRLCQRSSMLHRSHQQRPFLAARAQQTPNQGKKGTTGCSGTVTVFFTSL